jgi:hypothetical protein
MINFVQVVPSVGLLVAYNGRVASGPVKKSYSGDLPLLIPLREALEGMSSPFHHNYGVLSPRGADAVFLFQLSIQSYLLASEVKK